MYFSCRTVVRNRELQIDVGFFFLIEFKVFFYYFSIYLINIGWIQVRICMDPELLPGSVTQKIQSWIRNKSFRIINTGWIRIRAGKMIGSLTDTEEIEISKSPPSPH